MSSVCSNCGRPGHFYRECREPITSLGIIAFRRPVVDRVEWLLIRRRVSIGFIEIMRGKYEIRDVETIQALVDQATVTEREQLLTRSFADLWRDLWNGAASRRYHNEYEQARAKFEILKSRNILRDAVTASTTTWAEPEWGFPKGRRSSTETELACALRETYEEAGVKKEQLTIIDANRPLLEEYRGSNGISYRHRYWLAQAPGDLSVRLDPMNIDQIREISDVRWCSLGESMALIRPYNTEKRTVLAIAAGRIGNENAAPIQRRDGGTTDISGSTAGPTAGWASNATSISGDEHTPAYKGVGACWSDRR